jgi:CDP-diacylglycerol--glycerol-3-phosphate 3-phosphatidyltransferase
MSASSHPELSEIPAWKKRLPMALTWGRMAVCPFFVPMLMAEAPIWGWIASALFIAASITDWFDGYFARRFKAISNLGKFMDPIADKILVATVMILLLPTGRIDPIVVIILLVRDILIGGIRSVAAADNVIIDAKATGKWKTAVQMAAIPMLLIHTPVLGFPFAETGRGLLWVSAVLSLVSGFQYVQLYNVSRKST